MSEQEDSLVAAIEGNFKSMSHSDLVLTCEMLTRGREAWKKECEDAHIVLDHEDCRIIRNAKDGYPDGREDRTLTLAERTKALLRMKQDYKRWMEEHSELLEAHRQQYANKELEVIALRSELDAARKERDNIKNEFAIREITIAQFRKENAALADRLQASKQDHRNTQDAWHKDAQLKNELWEKERKELSNKVRVSLREQAKLAAQLSAANETIKQLRSDLETLAGNVRSVKRKL